MVLWFYVCFHFGVFSFFVCMFFISCLYTHTHIYMYTHSHTYVDLSIPKYMHGIFSFQICWSITRTQSPYWPFYSLTWLAKHSPKMSICLVKALHGKLLTSIFWKSLLLLMMMFVFCARHMYRPWIISISNAYIHFTCVKLGISSLMGTLYDEATLINYKFKQKCNISTLAKLVFSAVVWHMWRERNSRIFQGESKQNIQVYKEIYEDTQILMQKCTWKLAKGSTLNSTPSN